MSNEETNLQSSATDGYVSFVAHIWVGENGKLIRGTIEDAHTGSRMALDLSEVAAFLQASLAHSPGQTWNLQNNVEVDKNEEALSEGSREGSSGADDQGEHTHN